MLFKILMTFVMLSFNQYNFFNGVMLLPFDQEFHELANQEENFVGAVPNMPVYKITCQPKNNDIETNFASLGDIDASSHISEIIAMAWTRGGVALLGRGSFAFNFNSLPKSARIVSAKLSLFSNRTPLNGSHGTANAGYNNAFYIYRNLSFWDEKTKWDSQPNVEAGTQVLMPHTSHDFLDVENLEVKGMVQSMRTNGNHGFKIQLATERKYSIRNFVSSLHEDASRHPKLVIYYQLP